MTAKIKKKREPESSGERLGIVQLVFLFALLAVIIQGTHVFLGDRSITGFAAYNETNASNETLTDNIVIEATLNATNESAIEGAVQLTEPIGNGTGNITNTTVDPNNITTNESLNSTSNGTEYNTSNNPEPNDAAKPQTDQSSPETSTTETAANKTAETAANETLFNESSTINETATINETNIQANSTLNNTINESSLNRTTNTTNTTTSWLLNPDDLQPPKIITIDCLPLAIGPGMNVGCDAIIADEIELRDVTATITDPEGIPTSSSLTNAGSAYTVSTSETFVPGNYTVTWTAYDYGNHSAIVPDQFFVNASIETNITQNATLNTTLNTTKVTVANAINIFNLSDIAIDEQLIQGKATSGQPVNWTHVILINSSDIPVLSTEIPDTVLFVDIQEIPEDVAYAQYLTTEVYADDESNDTKNTSDKKEKKLKKPKYYLKKNIAPELWVTLSKDALKIIRKEIKENTTNYTSPNGITGSAVTVIDHTRSPALRLLDRIISWFASFSITGRAVIDTTPATLEITTNSSSIKAYKFTYTTRPAAQVDEILSDTAKQVTISSEVHYTDVEVNTSITLPEKGNVHVYWLHQGLREELPFQFADANNDSIQDTVIWTAPHLSNQTFEVSITVLNVYEFPKAGDNWTVILNTTGIADLNITSPNAKFEEVLADNANTEDELEMLELRCGDTILTDDLIIISGTTQYNYSDIANDSSITIDSFILPEYGCPDLGYFTSLTNIPGYATLALSFGGEIAYAYDPSELNRSNITYPNGGEMFTNQNESGTSTGDTVNITFTDVDGWNGEFITYYIEYSSNDGGAWTLLGNTSLNYYEWDVSDIANSTQYLVRVTAGNLTVNATADESDNNFWIGHCKVPSTGHWLINNEVTICHDRTINLDGATIRYIGADSGTYLGLTNVDIPNDYGRFYQGGQGKIVNTSYPGIAYVYVDQASRTTSVQNLKIGTAYTGTILNDSTGREIIFDNASITSPYLYITGANSDNYVSDVNLVSIFLQGTPSVHITDANTSTAQLYNSYPNQITSFQNIKKNSPMTGVILNASTNLLVNATNVRFVNPYVYTSGTNAQTTIQNADLTYIYMYGSNARVYAYDTNVSSVAQLYSSGKARFTNTILALLRIYGTTEANFTDSTITTVNQIGTTTGTNDVTLRGNVTVTNAAVTTWYADSNATRVYPVYVLDGNGNGISGAEVNITNNSVTLWTGTTDSSGLAEASYEFTTVTKDDVYNITAYTPAKTWTGTVGFTNNTPYLFQRVGNNQVCSDVDACEYTSIVDAFVGENSTGSGIEITEGGIYTLDGKNYNISTGAGDALLISADDVAFDCNGTTISGTSGNAIYAIGQTNITLQNCIFADQDYGIVLEETNASVSNVTHTAMDLYVDGIYSTNFTDLIFANTSGRVTYPSIIEPGEIDTWQNILIASNTIFVNSSNVADLNTTAELEFYSIDTGSGTKPTVDYTDTGSFIRCPTSKCPSYTVDGTTFYLNVTSFSTFGYDNITSCNEIITSDSTLNSDLNCSSWGIALNASDITLDCAGYTLKFNGTSGAYIGISAGFDDATKGTTGLDFLDNITIQDCRIENFNTGIVTNMSHSYVQNNTVYNASEVGIAFSGANNTIQNNNVTTVQITTPAYGIAGVDYPPGYSTITLFNNTVQYNTIADIATNGLALLAFAGTATNNTLRYNNVTSDLVGVKLDSSFGGTQTGTIVYNNILNTSGDFPISTVASVTDSNISYNTLYTTSGSYPITLATGASNNLIYLNDIYGDTTPNDADGNSDFNVSGQGNRYQWPITFATDDPGCYFPEDGVTFTGGFDLCSGTYVLNDSSNDGAMEISASGAVLNCEGTVIQGQEYGLGFNVSSTGTDAGITNCIFDSWPTAISIGAHGAQVNNTNFTSVATGITLEAGAQNVSLSNLIFNGTILYVPTTANLTGSNVLFAAALGLLDYTTFSVNASQEFNSSTDIQIGDNYVYANSSKVGGLDSAADLTFYGLSWTSAPKAIIDDDDDGVFQICSGAVCTSQSYLDGVFTMSVTGFTNYSTNDTVICGETITTSKTLGGDLVNSTGGNVCPDDGVIIGSDDIVLDCAGYAINYAGTSQGHGINISNKDNVTIQNCVLSGSRISSMGIYAENINNSVITSTNATTSDDYSIRITNTENVNITDLNITNTDAQAVYIEPNTTMLKITDSWFRSLNASTISTSGVSGSTINDLMISDNIIIMENDANNGFVGISISTGSQEVTLNNNNISGTATQNVLSGISISHTNNTLINNNKVVLITNDTTNTHSGISQLISGGNNVNITNNFINITGDQEVRALMVYGAITTLNNYRITNNTIYSEGNSSFGLTLGTMDNSFATGNAITTSGVGSAFSTYLVGNENLSISDTTITQHTQGIGVLSTISTNVTMSNTTITGNHTEVSIGLYSRDDISFTMIDTEIANVSAWFYVNNSAFVNLSDTTFINTSGAIKYSYLNLSTTGIIDPINNTYITQNKTFVNSTALPELNTTAELTFYGITASRALPFYDLEDDGTYVFCPAERCTSYYHDAVNDIFYVNVTSFTSYATNDQLICGDTITTSTTLTEDLKNSSGGTICPADGIIIGGDDVVLDCAGFSITGDKGAGDIGITANTRDNITIINCTIDEFDEGIDFNTITNSYINDSTIKNVSNRGIDLVSTTGIVIDNNTISNATSAVAYGISLQDTSQTTITHNTISDMIGSNSAAVFGYIVSSIENRAYVEYNTLSDNAFVGIVFYRGHNSTISHNVMDNSGINGWAGYAINNTAYNNTITNSDAGAYSALLLGDLTSGEVSRNNFTNNTIINTTGAGVLFTIISQTNTGNVFSDLTIINATTFPFTLNNIDDLIVESLTITGTNANQDSISVTGGSTNITFTNTNIYSAESGTDGLVISGSTDIYSTNAIINVTGESITVASNGNLTSTNDILRGTELTISTDSEFVASGLTMETTNGSINFSSVSVDTSTAADSTGNIIIGNNTAFVNSTSLSDFNVSAAIELRTLQDSGMFPHVDTEDDGSFVICGSPRCTGIAYTSGTLSFTVASFTNYTGQSTLQCGDTITTSTTLSAPLYNSTGGIICPDNGLIIGADDIVLNCADYSIQYAGTSAGAGINATQRDNVTIQNCDLSSTRASSPGIYLNGTNNSLVTTSNITTDGTDAHGVQVITPRAVNITDLNITCYDTECMRIDYDAVDLRITSNAIYARNDSAISSTFSNKYNFNNTRITDNTIDLVNNLENSAYGMILSQNMTDSIISNNNLTLLNTQTGAVGIYTNGLFNVNITENLIEGTSEADTSSSGIFSYGSYSENIRYVDNDITMTGLNDTIGLILSGGLIGDPASSIIIANNSLNITGTQDGTRAISVGRVNNTAISNNDITINASTIGYGYVATYTNNTNVSDNTIVLRGSLIVGALQQIANNVQLSNNNFTAIDGTLAIGAYSIQANDDLFVNNRFANFTDWFLVMSTTNANWTDTTFLNVSSEAYFPYINMTTAGLINASQNFFLDDNQIFVNSTALPALNTSAELTFYNRIESRLFPYYDDNDDLVYEFCPIERCSAYNHDTVNDIFYVNVTSFTSYSTGDQFVCGDTITTSTTLIDHMRNLTGGTHCPYTGLEIASDDVSLDCAGYGITFAYLDIGYGVDAPNVDNITIQNCNISSGTGTGNGIRFDNTNNSLITANNITVTIGKGIDATGGANNTIFSNSIITEGTGTLKYGIHIQDYATRYNISSNTISANGTSNSNLGIFLQNYISESLIDRNNVSSAGSSGSFGFRGFDHVSDTNVTNNDFTAIATTSSAVAISVVRDSYNNLVEYNNVTVNAPTGAGGLSVSLNSTNNIFRYNTGTIIATGSNALGITIESSNDNHFVSNTLTSNAAIFGTSAYLNGESMNNNLSSNTLTADASTFYGFGVYLVSKSTNNNVENNDITVTGTINNFGLAVSENSTATFTNNNVTMTGLYAYGILAYESNSSIFNNTRVNTTEWVSAYNSTENELYDTYFINASGQAHFDYINLTPGATNLNTTSNFIIGENSIFVNSTTLPDFNTSANLTFYGMSALADGRPFYDAEDDGDFIICPSTRCASTFGYDAATENFLVNVTSFTTYSILDKPICGDTVNKSYVLDGDIQNTTGGYYCDGTALTLNNDSITMDCAGYTIQYAATEDGYGVHANGKTNVTTHNCTIIQVNNQTLNSHGIYLQSTTDSRATWNNITTTGDGSSTIFNNGARNNITDNLLSVTEVGGTRAGVYLSSASNANIWRNSITTSGTDNDNDAIYALSSTAASIINNSIDTYRYGVYRIGQDSYIHNNTFVLNNIGANVIYLLSSDRTIIDKNTMQHHTSGNLIGGTGDHVQLIHNTINITNGGSGPFFSSNTNVTVYNNTIDMTSTTNGAYGFYTGGTYTNFTGNTVRRYGGGNAGGVRIGGDYATIKDNEVHTSWSSGVSGNPALYLAPANHAIIDNNTFNATSYGNAVYIIGTTNVTAENVRAFSDTSNTLYLYTGTTDSVFRNINITNTGTATALQISGSTTQNNQFDNTHIQGAYYGLLTYSNDTIMNNTVFNDTGKWFYVGPSARVQFYNTTFINENGTAFYSENNLTTDPGETWNTDDNFIINHNSIFVNSTALPPLNESAQLNFKDMSSRQYGRPLYNEDDGVWKLCTSPRCTNYAYNPGTQEYEVNVTKFTTYSILFGLLCGDNVSIDISLDTDVFNSTGGTTCPAEGLTINASGIALNCSGKSITGSGTDYGVTANGLSDVTLKNCHIQEFYSGANFTDSQVTTENNTLNNNTYGYYFNDSNVSSTDDMTYNNVYDLFVGASAPATLNLTNFIFTNPTGSLENYSNISLNDTLAANSAFFINWSANPGSVPPGRTSFNDKYVDITTLWGSVSIDFIIWYWLESEIGGFNENLFELWEYSAPWLLMNGTPDTTNNQLSLANFNPNSVYGIFEGAVSQATRMVATELVYPSLTTGSATPTLIGTDTVNVTIPFTGIFSIQLTAERLTASSDVAHWALYVDEVQITDNASFKRSMSSGNEIGNVYFLANYTFDSVKEYNITLKHWLDNGNINLETRNIEIMLGTLITEDGDNLEGGLYEFSDTHSSTGYEEVFSTPIARTQSENIFTLVRQTVNATDATTVSYYANFDGENSTSYERYLSGSTDSGSMHNNFVFHNDTGTADYKIYGKNADAGRTTEVNGKFVWVSTYDDQSNYVPFKQSNNATCNATSHCELGQDWTLITNASVRTNFTDNGSIYAIASANMKSSGGSNRIANYKLNISNADCESNTIQRSLASTSDYGSLTIQVFCDANKTGVQDWNVGFYGRSGSATWEVHQFENSLSAFAVQQFDIVQAALGENATAECKTITAAGTHTLMGNVSGAPFSVPEISFVDNACIKITSDDVIFDCMGYNITNNGTSNAAAIVVNSTGGGFTNITIQNCPNIKSYEQGIVIDSATDVSIQNGSITNTSSGITAFNTSANIEIDAMDIAYASKTKGYGVNASDATNVTIKSSTILKINDSVGQGHGIYFYTVSDSFITDNTLQVNGSQSRGIYLWLGSNTDIYRNSINITGSGNAKGAIHFYAYSDSRIMNNSFNMTATGSAIPGIFFQLSTSARNNVSGNNITNVADAGIQLDSHNNTLENNRVIRKDGTGYNIYMNSGIPADNIFRDNYISTGITKTTGTKYAWYMGSQAKRNVMDNNTVVLLGSTNNIAVWNAAATATDNVYANGTIIVNGTATNRGLYLGSAGQTTVKNMDIQMYSTVGSATAIHIQNSDSNTLTNNTLFVEGGASNYGIYAQLADNLTADATSIEMNAVSTSNEGVYLSESKNVSFTDTEISISSTSSGYGIRTASASDNLTFTNTNITTTGTAYGLRLSETNYSTFTNTLFNATPYWLTADVNTHNNLSQTTFDNSNGTAYFDFIELDTSTGAIDTQDNFYIVENNITVNSTALSQFNVSANLTFKNMADKQDARPLYRYGTGDWAPCFPDRCPSYAYQPADETYKVNVTKFTTYSILYGLMCGDTINRSITMDTDVYNSTGGYACPDDGLYINNESITLDCSDRAIRGSLAVGSQGIYIDNNDSITIANCTITDFETDIYATDSQNNQFYWNTLANSTNEGVYLENVNNTNITENSITNITTDGVELLTTRNIYLAWNNISNIGNSGILSNFVGGQHFDLISEYNRVSSGPGGIVYYTTNDSIIQHNTIDLTGANGVLRNSNNNLMYNNTITNTDTSLAFSLGALLTYEDTGSSANNTLRANTITNVSGNALFVVATGVTVLTNILIEDNNASNFSQGIYISHANDVRINNTRLETGQTNADGIAMFNAANASFDNGFINVTADAFDINNINTVLNTSETTMIGTQLDIDTNAVFNATNLTMQNDNGSILFSAVDVDSATATITAANIDINYNEIRVDSTTLPDFNVSSTLTFENMSSYSTRGPQVDFEDDSTFISCPASACPTYAYISATEQYEVNVTRFTTYRIGNNPPTTTAPTVNNTAPYTNDKLNCTNGTYSDVDSDPENVPGREYLWYKNDVLIGGETTFSLDLSTAGNGDKNDNITCAIRVHDGTDFSEWVNSSNEATVQNTPPTQVTLIAPSNGNDTLITLWPWFNWTESIDVDGDGITYYVNITSELCNDVIESTTDLNHTLVTELGVDIYCGTYNWTIIPGDGDDNGTISESWNFSIQPYLDLILSVDLVDFGTMLQLDINDTTDDSPPPFIIYNDGNINATLVNVSASPDLFDSVAMPSDNFQMKVDNVTGEEGAFNWSGSATDWINVSDQNVTLMYDLDFHNATDSAEIDIRVDVPEFESAGVKTTNLTFTWEPVI